jgi:hypothetical protein
LSTQRIPSPSWSAGPAHTWQSSLRIRPTLAQRVDFAEFGPSLAGLGRYSGPQHAI